MPYGIWRAHGQYCYMGMVNERSALYGANTHVAIALETGDQQY